jgi:hypothetical protein
VLPDFQNLKQGETIKDVVDAARDKFGLQLGEELTLKGYVNEKVESEVESEVESYAEGEWGDKAYGEIEKVDGDIAKPKVDGDVKAVDADAKAVEADESEKEKEKEEEKPQPEKFRVGWLNPREFEKVVQDEFGVFEFPRIVVQKKGNGSHNFVYDGLMEVEAIKEFIHKVQTGEVG